MFLPAKKAGTGSAPCGTAGRETGKSHHTSPILKGQVREPPDIAQPHCITHHGEDEIQLAGPVPSGFIFIPHIVFLKRGEKRCEERRERDGKAAPSAHTSSAMLRLHREGAPGLGEPRAPLPGRSQASPSGRKCTKKGVQSTERSGRVSLLLIPLGEGVPIASPGAGSSRWPLEGQEVAPIPSAARRNGNGFFPSGLQGKCGWAGGEGLWGVESGIPSLPGPLIASLGCIISPEFWLWGPRHAEEPEEGKGQAPFTCGQEQPSR